MAPVHGARYNIRRKVDKTPTKSTTASKETNVQQRQELKKCESTHRALSHITSPFPHTPARARTHQLWLVASREMIFRITTLQNEFQPSQSYHLTRVSEINT